MLIFLQHTGAGWRCSFYRGESSFQRITTETEEVCAELSLCGFSVFAACQADLHGWQSGSSVFAMADFICVGVLWSNKPTTKKGTCFTSVRG